VSLGVIFRQFIAIERKLVSDSFDALFYKIFVAP